MGRVAWTLGIYLLALLPALLVSDIGPVLSITGSLGGSCLAYIGPGCVYLGLNGEHFLTIAYKLLGNDYNSNSREEFKRVMMIQVSSLIVDTSPFGGMLEDFP